jgi:hypothetical protein
MEKIYVVDEILKELEGLPIEQEFTPEDFTKYVEVEGLDENTLNSLGMLLPVAAYAFKKKMVRHPRTREIIERKIQRGIIVGETGLWYHGKMPRDAATIEYFSAKQSGERFNFKVDGIQPEKDTIITGISAFFEPLKTTPTDIDSIISKMINADIILKIGDEEKLKLPLSYILDFNPVVALDGNTTATNLVYFRNSKLEKGIFKLDNISYPAKKTLQLTVDFKESFTNTTYWLFFAIEYKK